MRAFNIWKALFEAIKWKSEEAFGVIAWQMQKANRASLRFYENSLQFFFFELRKWSQIDFSFFNKYFRDRLFPSWKSLEENRGKIVVIIFVGLSSNRDIFIIFLLLFKIKIYIKKKKERKKIISFWRRKIRFESETRFHYMHACCSGSWVSSSTSRYSSTIGSYLVALQWKWPALMEIGFNFSFTKSFFHETLS